MYALAQKEELKKEQIQNTYEKERTKIAVCGLHMRGFELEHQLTDLGGIFESEELTAPLYKMYELSGKFKKPGMVKVNEGGKRLKVECYSLPTQNVGAFLKLIPAPLGLGKIILESNEEVIGFICEAAAVESEVDITSYGGWRNYRASV